MGRYILKQLHSFILLIVLFITLTAISGCASSNKQFAEAFWPELRQVQPTWFVKPGATLDIAWTRAHSTIPEIKDGVCRLFYSDSDEVAMEVADQQVHACIASGSGVSATTPAGTRRIHLHFVNSNREVSAAWDELFDVGNVPAYRQSGDAASGFYYDANGVCTVVVNRNRPSIGHEIKHCFDGNFHQGYVLRVPLRSGGLSGIFIR